MQNAVIEKDGILLCSVVPGVELVPREVKQKIPIEGARFADCPFCRGLSDQGEVLCDDVIVEYCKLTGKGVVVVDRAKN